MPTARYVDPENPWEDSDDEWKYPQTDFERMLLDVCHRKYFHKESEAKSARAIERLGTGDKPKYPREYVTQVIDWARAKNKMRTIIGLGSLLKAIRNPDNLAKYYKGEPVGEDRGGYGSFTA